MEHNNLQSNTQSNLTYNAPFRPTTPPNVGQQEAQAQAGPVPPLESASDLSAPVSPRSLQNYRTSRPLEEEPDTFNLPEYQPIKPGEPYLEKLADEAANTRKIERSLKHAQECEADGDLQDAEKAYKQALKFTENAEHYKLYAACLKNLSASSKDEVKEKIYKEKASKAFYFLGEFYTQQEAWKPAQTAYKTSCELVTHEIPLKALVAASRQLGEKGGIVEALKKLADFYAGKGKIDLAIKMLEEALQVEKSSTLLEKLAAFHRQSGGENNQLKLNETRIQQFELQISQESKNQGIYRDYAWFLESIGRQDEARAVIKRMDAMLQAMQYELFQTLQQTFIKKKVKDKAKIVDLKQTVQTQAEIIANLSTKVKTNASKSSKEIDVLQKKLISLENEKLPAQAKKLELTITDFNQKISSQAGDIANLSTKLETNTSKSSKDIDVLQKKLISLENEKLPAQAKSIQTLNTQLETLKKQAQANATKTDAAIDTLDKKVEFSKMTSLSLNNLCTNSLYEPRDQDIIPLLLTNPNLKYLSLQRCRHLTDAVLIVIPERFGNLEYLNLASCQKMTLAGLSAMIDRLPRLRRLLYWQINGTAQEHQALIRKLNARGIVHAGLNF